jgi:hypothetical protein
VQQCSKCMQSQTVSVSSGGNQKRAVLANSTRALLVVVLVHVLLSTSISGVLVLVLVLVLFSTELVLLVLLY